MVVQVHLHTTVQVQTAHGPVRWLKLRLPEQATVQDALEALNLHLNLDNLILVVNHHVVGEKASLNNGDRLDIIPAISGG